MGLKEFYPTIARQEVRQEIVTKILNDGLYNAEGIARVLHVDEAEIREIERNIACEVSSPD